MPIYEYRCERCQHKLEAIQKISDEPLVDCPACAQPGLKKLISAAGFRLKGGGWYETDFKSGNKKGLADSAGSGGESSAGASSSASETASSSSASSAE